jgi:iron complex transport system ATP-binding protein
VGEILTLREVGFEYRSVPVLRGVSLGIDRGEILGVLGPNGSGKSTLLNLMDGVLRPTAGEVLLNRVPLRQMKRKALAREVAMVAQEHHFRFGFSVTEVVLMGRFPHLRALEAEGERDVAIVREALGLTGCLDFADRSIHALSGGERQRVLIARALAQEPALILLDEPTSFLDLKFKREIFMLVDRLSRRRGLSFVVASHDLDLIARYCTRVLMLKDGSIHRIGPVDEVITQGDIEAVFDCPVRVERHPATGRPHVSVL